MNRREFLKVLSVIPASVLIPPLDLKPIESETIQTQVTKRDNIPDGTWFITPEGDRFEVESFSMYMDYEPIFSWEVRTPIGRYVSYEIEVVILGYYGASVCISDDIVMSTYRHRVEDPIYYIRDEKNSMIVKFDGYKIIHKGL